MLKAFLIYTCLLHAPPVLSNSFNSPNSILLADSVEQSPSWEVASSSTTQEFPNIL
jgi:hypothetical protein